MSLKKERNQVADYLHGSSNQLAGEMLRNIVSTRPLGGTKWKKVNYNLRLVRVANWTLRRGCAPPYAMAEADERPGERVALSIGTFNVLAPCHKRERAARFERGSRKGAYGARPLSPLCVQ